MSENRLAAYEVVRLLGGSASWAQIKQHTTRHSLAQALATGTLRRVGRGVYAIPESALPYGAAVAGRGLVSHQSAARHWRFETLTPDRDTHITVPRHARPRPMRGVNIHFTDVPADDDHGGVTSPVRTVLDCARSLPFAQALSIADSALRLGVVDADELVEAAVRRRGSGRRRVLRVAEAADGRAANAFESGLRAIVIDSGITGFEPQHEIRLPGRTAWLDLGDPDRQVALEADSFAFHGSPEALRRDCRRHDELICLGWLPLRFAYDHVVLEPAWVAGVVRDTCALREKQRHRTRPKSS